MERPDFSYGLRATKTAHFDRHMHCSVFTSPRIWDIIEKAKKNPVYQNGKGDMYVPILQGNDKAV